MWFYTESEAKRWRQDEQEIAGIEEVDLLASGGWFHAYFPVYNLAPYKCLCL